MNADYPTSTPTTSQLPSPPFVTVPGISNFRDCGGYALASPATGSVRRHYLFRSARTDGITEAGEKVLRDVLGIRTIYDFRSQPEIENQKSKGSEVPSIDGVQYVHAPVFSSQDYNPESIALRFKDYAEGGTEGFVRAYGEILASGGPSFGRIFRHIIDQPDSPFLVHCSGGKDRTGVVVVLILSIVGVSHVTIADEYELTQKGIEGMKSTMVDHLAPMFGGDKEAVQRMISARKEYMEATLKMIQEKYGGAEAYAKSQCGLSDSDLAKMKMNMKAEVSAVL